MRNRIRASYFIAILLLSSAVCLAETYVPESSNRVKINFGATPWKFMRSDPTNAQTVAFKRRRVEKRWHSSHLERHRHLRKPE